MPRFYLHLDECGSITKDADGIDLPDLSAALREAESAARDMMATEIKAGKLCLGCCVIIADETGEVARMPFRQAIQLSGI